MDLDSEQTVRSVGTNFLNYHWQRMWAPERLDVSVSTDGISYTKEYTQTVFPVNGINTVKTTMLPTKARYVKLVAKNKGIIPPGEYGAGGKALLMIDEIKME